jgi:hypothetical protein
MVGINVCDQRIANLSREPGEWEERGEFKDANKFFDLLQIRFPVVMNKTLPLGFRPSAHYSGFT